MNGAMTPRKRRRTRSSAIVEESASKRPNRNPESDYPDAIAAAAHKQAIEADQAVPREDPVPEPAELLQGQTESSQQEQEQEPRPEPSQQVQIEHTPQDQDEPAELEQRQSEELNSQEAQDAAILAVTGPVAEDYARDGTLGGYGLFMDNWADPSLHLRIQSLPILENLSVQILETLAKGSYQETLTIVTEPESAPGQAYATLKSLFDQTKKLYSQREPFLPAYDLNLRDHQHRNIIRKANLATFVSSIFGSQDVGFYHLNEYFLETFVQDGGRLLKSQGQLFLELKTQAYLSAMANGERSRVEILEDLFPDDLGDRLMSRRPHAKQLTPSELEFINRARNRCEMLLKEPDDEESMAALPDKYVWEDFLRDVSSYVSRNFEDLVAGQAMKSTKSRAAVNTNGEYASHPPQHQLQHQHHQHQYRSAEETQPQTQPHSQFSPEDARLREVLYNHNQRYAEPEPHHNSRQEAVEKAARAAQAALQHDMLGSNRTEHEPTEEEQPRKQEAETVAQDTTVPSNQAQSSSGMADIPYHTQSAPTQVLYERARLAATAKASPNNRRAGLPSQRRPWTTEEENALMAGLDRVKGPHWSQILAMFGAGGTINESLKDRNQVQLKDKARNLKLFFLKSGIEVPYYLQFVTGELKTRAPSQAAKNEAKERARIDGDDDRAHVEGVMALASTAHQNIADNGAGVTQDEHEHLDLGEAQESQRAQDGQADDNSATEADYEQQMVQQLRAAEEAEQAAAATAAVAAAAAVTTAPEPAPEVAPDTRTRRSARVSGHSTTA